MSGPAIARFDDLLAEVTTTVLEELAFCSAMPIELDEDIDDEETRVGSVVRFTGSFDGWLELRVPSPFSTMLAANMLGVDEAPSAMRYDAVGEIANVIAGNLLPRLHDPSASFMLDVFVHSLLPEYEGAPEVATTHLDAEGHNVSVRLFASIPTFTTGAA